MTNAIRPYDSTSFLGKDEVQTEAKRQGMVEILWHSQTKGRETENTNFDLSRPKGAEGVCHAGRAAESDGRGRRVVGGGMCGRLRHVKQGDLSGTRTVFMAP